MTPEARMIWEMICFDLCMLQYDIAQAKRHTTGMGLGI